MASVLNGDVPLASKNRLGYTPPGSERTNNMLDTASQTVDSPTESYPSERTAKPFSSESIFTLLSTSYSLLIVAFFKSLVDSLRVSVDPIAENQELRDDAALNFPSDPDFPGESTPLNTSIMEENTKTSGTVLEKKHDTAPRHNIYHSLFDLDSSDDDDLDIRQYGTTLQISESSKYKPDSKLQPAPESRSDVTAAGLLDTEFPTLDEYDKVIRNFYTPLKPVPSPKYSLTDAMLAAIPSYDFSQFLRKEREKVQSLIFQERKESQSKIHPLNNAQQAAVEKLWGSRQAHQPVVSDFSIDITVKDIKTLADGCWLNDNIIDFYLNLVAARSGNIFCWTTHFFSTLKSNGYKGVARWAKRKKVNLIEKDLVIVPINIMGTHWAVAVIDNKNRTIGYYDSLSSRGNLKALQLLDEYMSKESERLEMPQIEYTLQPNMKTPQQQNGFDCGVFTCTVAKCLSENSPLSFSQKDMRLIRRRMAYEIITNSLLGGPPEAHL